jgi:hypothetical protein
MIHRLGNVDPFLPEGIALGEYVQLGMAHGEPGPGGHGRQDSEAETLATPCPVEDRHGLPEAVDRLMIAALGVVGCTKVEICQRVQANLPTRRGKREGTLGGSNGLVLRAPTEKIVCQRDRDLCQPTCIVEGGCEGLSLTQRCEDAPPVAQR